MQIPHEDTAMCLTSAKAGETQGETYLPEHSSSSPSFGLRLLHARSKNFCGYEVSCICCSCGFADDLDTSINIEIRCKSYKRLTSFSKGTPEADISNTAEPGYWVEWSSRPAQVTY